jgi:hypothetical protein
MRDIRHYYARLEMLAPAGSLKLFLELLNVTAGNF